MKRALVTYFSASGTTKKVAQTLADATDGDLFEIAAKTPYSSADLNWHNRGSRSSVEMNNPEARPQVAAACDTADYDVIFVGYPIWWYTAPRIIQTFVEQTDLEGKTVVTFCTSGSSDIGDSTDDLARTAPRGITWVKGQRFTPKTSKRQLELWSEQYLR